MSSIQSTAPIRIRREGGDWLVATRAMPELSASSAEELLRHSALLSGNARLARTAEGIVMLADVYLDDSDEAVSVGEERLGRWFDGAGAGGAASTAIDALVESLLAEQGLTFERHEDVWHAALPEGTDVVVRLVDGGLRVEGSLVRFDDKGGLAGSSSDERRALTEFLCRAQAGMRFARTELSASAAIVAGACETASLAGDLDRAIACVRGAYRRLAAEASAFANLAVAQNYLAFVVSQLAGDGGAIGAPGESTVVS